MTPTVFRSNPIWTDQQINFWATDAIAQISTDVRCIWAREALQITQGVSVVTLPSYVRTLQRVSWRGRTLDAENWEELQLLTPATVFVSPNSSANIQGTQSRPLYYALHPTNLYDIRFYPTPNESFSPSQISDVYSPQLNEPGCVIDYWREPDTTGSNPLISLPPYIARRTQKAYVLWKAFSAEGKGQDLIAAKYYMDKYHFLIEQFRAINEGTYVSKRYAVEDGMLAIDNFRYPKPTLPARFERTVF